MLEPVLRHFMKKCWSHLAHVTILDPKNFQNFVLIFLILLFIVQMFLSRAPRVSKDHENWVAPYACKHIGPQKISDFFEDFFKTRMYCSLDGFVAVKPGP